MDKVENAAAFVTGGASGIGLGIARALGAAGAKVAVADVREDHLEEARTVAAEEGWSNRAAFLQLDVTDRAAFDETLGEAEHALGPLRILVNNAGVGIAGPVAEATFPDWDWGISVNLGGVVNGLVLGLPRLRAHGLDAHIVNTASLGALMPARPTRGIYASTKAAIVALSEHLRLDLQESPIGVSVLLPGPTRTNIGESGVTRPAHLREGSRFVELEAQREGGPLPTASGARPVTSPSIPWLDPLEAGRMTLDAILGDRLYIVTHPEFLGAVKSRHEGIEKAIEEQKARLEG